MTTQYSDVLIVGGGAAGLSLALRLSQDDVSITLLSKCELTEGSSLYAQGGIAAVLDSDDNFDSHIDDTHNAGADLCKDAAVKKVVEGAPDAINWLIEKGVKFTLVDGAEYDGVDNEYHLTREGGHSHRRVIHVKDATGREVETTLEQHVRALPNVTILEDHIALTPIPLRVMASPWHGEQAVVLRTWSSFNFTRPVSITHTLKDHLFPKLFEVKAAYYGCRMAIDLWTIITN